MCQIRILLLSHYILRETVRTVRQLCWSIAQGEILIRRNINPTKSNDIRMATLSQSGPIVELLIIVQRVCGMMDSTESERSISHKVKA